MRGDLGATLTAADRQHRFALWQWQARTNRARRNRSAFLYPVASSLSRLCWQCSELGAQNPGLQKACPRCGETFYICTSCDRWHWYCSKFCSAEARRESRREAQRRYRSTDGGREAGRKNQRDYRARCGKDDKDDKTAKSVSDQSSATIEGVGRFLSVTPSPTTSKEDDRVVQQENAVPRVSHPDPSTVPVQRDAVLSPLAEKPVAPASESAVRTIPAVPVGSRSANRRLAEPTSHRKVGDCRVCGNPIHLLVSQHGFPRTG